LSDVQLGPSDVSRLNNERVDELYQIEQTIIEEHKIIERIEH